MTVADSNTYSISLRVRRTIVEYAYVGVPVTDAIMKCDEAGTIIEDVKGNAGIDMAKLIAFAVDLENKDATHWYPESTTVEPHPIQKAPESPGME